MSDDALDFLVRKAIKSGLNYLSLSPNHNNPKDAKWVGCYRHVENANCQYVTDDDPVEALSKAIRQGEAECKARRKQRLEVEEPMEREIGKIQKKNIAGVRAREAEQEAIRSKRRRDASDLI